MSGNAPRDNPGAHRYRIFLVAGEPSGDALGAQLIDALRSALPGVVLEGIGGAAMQSRKFQSLFPMNDIAVMGILPVIANLPRLIKRINFTSAAIIETAPDVLVIIDSPDFTHRVARKVRAANKAIKIINFVSPSVWAWRPARAERMRSYVDHVLALLPFEPAAHQRLGGPPCTYVGHPLMQRLDELRAGDLPQQGAAPALVVLPGSRGSEIKRLMPVFGETVARIQKKYPTLQCVLPASSNHVDAVHKQVKDWKVKPQIITGEREKFVAFRNARAALAASGTVALELALAQTPMVIAYKVSGIEGAIAARMITSKYVSLPNIILDRPLVPECLQSQATAQKLSAHLLPLMQDGPERARQLQGFAQVESLMQLEGTATPSQSAAEIIKHYAEQ